MTCYVIVGSDVCRYTGLDYGWCRWQGNDGDGRSQHSGDYLLRYGGPIGGLTVTISKHLVASK